MGDTTSLRRGPAPPPDLDELVERLKTRQPRAVAQAISIVERGGRPAAELLARVYPSTGRATVVGITGPPGAGKSTLVDRLAQEYRRRGETVGILCVDPTSPFTGGALLGDRIRMQGLATDRGVYIRSMATRGAMGGLARATRDAADILDAAGFDRVLVETVGVGQDEVDVVATVDTVLVVAVPGLGDDIQAIKAGILEIADLFVLNKSDRDGADRVARDLEMMMSLGHSTRARPTRGADDSAQVVSGWMPPIVRTVASRGEGIPELAAAIDRHRDFLAASGELAARRRSQLKLRVETILKDRVLAEAEQKGGLERQVERAFESRIDPYALSEELFNGLIKSGGGAVISGIAHIGIAVRSIAEGRRFYEALGLAVSHIEEVPQEKVRVAMIPCGGATIELLEPTSDDSPIAKFLEKRGPGIHHLCLSSDDVGADDAALRAAGIDLLRPAPTAGAGGTLVQFVHPRSAGGVLVELSEAAGVPGPGREGE